MSTKAIFYFPSTEQIKVYVYPEIMRGLKVNNSRPIRCEVIQTENYRRIEEAKDVTKWINQCVRLAMHPKHFNSISFSKSY